MDPENKTKICFRCEKTEDEVDLLKCPVCFKLYCNECGHMHGGRKFCSKFCAEYFFFSDPDTDDV